MALVVTGGAAFAFWRVAGTGVGNGSTGVMVAVTLTPGAVTADLYPGASAAVTATAFNPNAAPVRLTALALDTSQGTNGFSVDGAHLSCPTSSFTFSTQTNSGNGWDLPASGSLEISLPGALSLATSASNACQGVIVTVFVQAT
ncbi:hypothetical protein [Cryobacterium sp. CG_9.6]|uniref:hypothetical protein n=1 Tax=Cryobacterium sp. CG_9.6 TaxID=2760710 RepID=UPI002475DBB0|nr:hypothetical protein [Cryobacterium sp. CG_9.6]MDH6238424.1 hypothetical protein [Cryobacterium sp. CG_9.6]